MAENRQLRQQLRELSQSNHIVGRCSVMQQIYLQIAQVADSRATVLIRGESGTGKEMVARAIHFSSSQRTLLLLPTDGAPLRKPVRFYEREQIVDALKKHRGNVASTVRYLQTTQRIMHYHRIISRGIEPIKYK